MGGERHDGDIIPRIRRHGRGHKEREHSCRKHKSGGEKDARITAMYDGADGDARLEVCLETPEYGRCGVPEARYF